MWWYYTEDGASDGGVVHVVAQEEVQRVERDFLRPSEISGSLGVTTGRIYQLLASGQLPSVRVGKAIRIPKKAFEEWVTAQTAQAKVEVAR